MIRSARHFFVLLLAVLALGMTYTSQAMAAPAAAIDEFSITDGSITPAFDPNTTLYTLTVDPGKSAIKLDLTASENLATISVNGRTPVPGPSWQTELVTITPGFVSFDILVASVANSTTRTYTFRLAGPASSAENTVSSVVNSFVDARQGMLAAKVEVPGLFERRGMATASGPVTASLAPNGDTATLNFATSFVQVNAAAQAAEGIIDVGHPTDAPFNVWLNGSYMVHNREQNGDRWGTFAMLSLGADYLINDKALVGLSFHLDQVTDPIDEDAEMTGTGWLAGPYGSLEVGEGVFFDASLLYGGSDNEIDTAGFDSSFDTTRWMFDTAIRGQWQLDDVTTLTPKLRAVYYTEETAAAVGIEGSSMEQFRVSLGAEVERKFALENGLTLTPSAGVTAGVSTLDASNMFGSLTTGLALSGPGNWSLDGDLLFNFDDEGAQSAGARAGLNAWF